MVCVQVIVRADAAGICEAEVAFARPGVFAYVDAKAVGCPGTLVLALLQREHARQLLLRLAPIAALTSSRDKGMGGESRWRQLQSGGMKMLREGVGG